jgi:hypothetical protein
MGPNASLKTSVTSTGVSARGVHRLAKWQAACQLTLVPTYLLLFALSQYTSLGTQYRPVAPRGSAVAATDLVGFLLLVASTVLLYHSAPGNHGGSTMNRQYVEEVQQVKTIEIAPAESGT